MYQCINMKWMYNKWYTVYQ